MLGCARSSLSSSCSWRDSNFIQCHVLLIRKDGWQARVCKMNDTAELQVKSRQQKLPPDGRSCPSVRDRARGELRNGSPVLIYLCALLWSSRGMFVLLLKLLGVRIGQHELTRLVEEEVSLRSTI